MPKTKVYDVVSVGIKYAQFTSLGDTDAKLEVGLYDPETGRTSSLNVDDPGGELLQMCRTLPAGATLKIEFSEP